MSHGADYGPCRAAITDNVVRRKMAPFSTPEGDIAKQKLLAYVNNQYLDIRKS